MKKIITVIYTLSFVIGAVSAQSVYDGVKIADYCCPLKLFEPKN